MFVLSIVIGLINGFLVGKLKLNAFMVTLAMLTLLRGLTMGLSGGKTSRGCLLNSSPSATPSGWASPSRSGSS